MKTQAVITINDADIKARVDQIIAGQLKTIVDEKLGNFVEGHLAKHKLQGRAPRAISDRIETIIQPPRSIAG